MGEVGRLEGRKKEVGLRVYIAEVAVGFEVARPGLSMCCGERYKYDASMCV